MFLLKRFKYLFSGIIFFCFLLAAKQEVAAQSIVLKVKITGIKHPGDTVRALLWKGERGFPSSKEKAYRKQSVQADDSVTIIVFDKLYPGEYAISCFYDWDNNRKYDRSWIFRSAEPFGLSGNPDYKNLPVKYEDAKFVLERFGKTVTIPLHYTNEAKSLLGW